MGLLGFEEKPPPEAPGGLHWRPGDFALSGWAGCRRVQGLGFRVLGLGVLEPLIFFFLFGV